LKSSVPQKNLKWGKINDVSLGLKFLGRGTKHVPSPPFKSLNILGKDKTQTTWLAAQTSINVWESLGILILNLGTNTSLTPPN